MLKIATELIEVSQGIHAIDLFFRPQSMDASKVCLAGLPADAINDRHYELGRQTHIGHIYDFADGVSEFATGGVESFCRHNNLGGFDVGNDKIARCGLVVPTSESGTCNVWQIEICGNGLYLVFDPTSGRASAGRSGAGPSTGDQNIGESVFASKLGLQQANNIELGV